MHMVYRTLYRGVLQPEHNTLTVLSGSLVLGLAFATTDLQFSKTL